MTEQTKETSKKYNFNLLTTEHLIEYRNELRALCHANDCETISMCPEVCNCYNKANLNTRTSAIWTAAEYIDAIIESIESKSYDFYQRECAVIDAISDIFSHHKTDDEPWGILFDVEEKLNQLDRSGYWEEESPEGDE